MLGPLEETMTVADKRLQNQNEFRRYEAIGHIHESTLILVAKNILGDSILDDEFNKSLYADYSSMIDEATIDTTKKTRKTQRKEGRKMDR